MNQKQTLLTPSYSTSLGSFNAQLTFLTNVPL